MSNITVGQLQTLLSQFPSNLAVIIRVDSPDWHLGDTTYVYPANEAAVTLMVVLGVI